MLKEEHCGSESRVKTGAEKLSDLISLCLCLPRPAALAQEDKAWQEQLLDWLSNGTNMLIPPC